MSVIHLILLLVVYTFGPGHVLIRRLRLAPGERFVAAIGVGLLLIHLLSFAIFALGLPPIAHLGVTGIALMLTALGRHDIRRVFASAQVRRMFLCWVCLFLFAAFLLAMIRNFGGGTWGGDWAEQFQRSQFFQVLNEELLGFRFIGQYPLPMRPPMMNSITANLLAQVVGTPDVGGLFESFQLIYLFLNSLVFLPCCLMVPRLIRLPARIARKTPWTLAALFAASPMVAQNLTYAWSKLFAAFYAVLAIAIYIRVVSRWRAHNGTPSQTARSAGRIGFTLAFAMMSAGFLVHFSVGPYALFLGLHYLLAIWWRRPGKLLEGALIAGVSALLLATWFAWSIAYYGVKPTFTSTSAVSDAAVMTPGENVLNIEKNLGNTLLPTILREPELMDTVDLEQQTQAGRVRDFAFLVYQVSLPFAFGLAGLPLLLYLLWRTGKARYPWRWFWLSFIPFVYVVGVVVYGGKDRFGVAHICLQPMVLLGLCLIAGGIWQVNIRWKGVLLTGLLFDAGFGVFLQMSMQHRLFPYETISARATDGTTQVVGYNFPAGPLVPSRAAQNNLKNKLELGVSFVGDAFGEVQPMLQFAAGGMLAILLFKGLWGTGHPAVSALDSMNRPVKSIPSRRKRRR